MGDGLSIGKTWTVTVPSDSARTINSNLWQYSVFPYTTPPSVMYPCDALSSMNDTQLMNFDYSVGSFMDMSTSLYANIMPMMKQWMAQQAEMYKKIMENLHSNTRITNPNPSDDDDDTSKIDGKKHVKEAKVVETLQRMANNPDIKSRFNTEITYTNKEGKDVKAKLIDRLTALCEEYRKSPDTAELSEDNFNTIWDIAGKFVKTGELTTADYKALLEIAKNPEGPGAYKKSDDDDDGDDENDYAQRTPQNVRERAKSSNGYEDTAMKFYNAMNHAATRTDDLEDACEETNKDNVLEIITAYNRKNNLKGDTLTLAEKIFDDCSNWGGGNNNGLFGWNIFGGDDAKPFMQVLTDALIARAQEFVDDKKAPEATLKELQNAINNLSTAFKSQKDASVDEKGENNLTKAFDDLYNKLYKAEEIAYKKFDKEKQLTTDEVTEGQQ